MISTQNVMDKKTFDTFSLFLFKNLKLTDLTYCTISYFPASTFAMKCDAHFGKSVCTFPAGRPVGNRGHM